MPTLQSVITLNTTLSDRQAIFDWGYSEGVQGKPRPHAQRSVWASIRGQYGFESIPTDLLTPPAANMKLDKSVAYGLTIQSQVTKLLDGTRVNACTSAGHCVKVCVLNNGNGAYPSVQRARDAKTEFFARSPLEFLYLNGWEIGRAVRKHDKLLYRPDVNSDLNWHRILGHVLPNGVKNGRVTSYGYTKHEDVFERPFTPHYIQAYSLNETSDLSAVQAFLDRGGKVAAVTDRTKTMDVEQWAHKLGLSAPVVDADKTDQWMLGNPNQGWIGDLSAKGKARSLIGKSDFVRVVY